MSDLLRGLIGLIVLAMCLVGVSVFIARANVIVPLPAFTQVTRITPMTLPVQEPKPFNIAERLERELRVQKALRTSA